MERTKGKIRFIPTSIEDSNVIGWIDMANHGVLTVASSANIDKAKAKANAAHLVKCWNAFEDNGLVGEMVENRDKALKFAEKEMAILYGYDAIGKAQYKARIAEILEGKG